jgi:prepilin-type N-terminal cleavage/methylation domain-containing protein/prepilin-type processing-associated H-X9-DG protein
MRNQPSRGFTLVELLVVITIIGILVGLLMPAVQSARESGRRTQCLNSVKNLSLACLQHETQYGFLPTGGWGYKWVGDPDRGFTRRQPGGWQYNILPFLDAGVIHDLGSGKSDSEKRRAVAAVLQSPQPIFICPSRRRAQVFPTTAQISNADPVQYAARSDYAANAGSVVNSSKNSSNEDGPTSFCIAAGPSDLSSGDKSSTTWQCGPGNFGKSGTQTSPNGVIYQRSETKMAEIRDGTGSTYLVAERYLNPDNYITGEDLGDQRNLYVGFHADTVRYTGDGSLDINGSYPAPPVVDTPGNGTLKSPFWRFGSAHADGFNAGFCDGSVKFLNYGIDAVTHQRLGSRNDRQAVTAP